MSTGKPAPTSRFVTSQRLRLHVTDWGNPDAPPLLLVHGGRDHGRSWDWVAQALRPDFHVLAPDLRGHGESDWAVGSSYGIAELVHDLDRLVRQEGLAPVTIVAHSLGGAASLLYAGLFPEAVRRMVVVEGTWQLDPAFTTRSRKPVEERMRGWMDQLRELETRQPRAYRTLDEAVERMQRENPHLSPEQARHLTEHGVRRREDGTYTWKFDHHIRAIAPNRFADEEVASLWSRIACPVLLVHGGASAHGDPAALGLLAHFQDARAVTIEGAGHWPHHDRLEEFLTVVRPFLGEAP
ncbi:alpha/beta fold hydrolase [Azospirillum sp.]|uniref:alpha/beta fold hydrolase n=1 Tax=Azospirillum sp. TaxID=34012 RepID=UPI003D740821